VWWFEQGQPNRELPAVKKLPLEKLAEAICVTADQLRTELTSGKKLVDILKEPQADDRAAQSQVAGQSTF